MESRDAGYHKQLIALRHHHIALRRGRYHEMYHGELSFAHARVHDSDRMIIAVNAGEQEHALTLTSKGVFADGLRLKSVFGHAQGNSFHFEDGRLALTLPPREAMILAASG